MGIWGCSSFSPQCRASNPWSQHSRDSAGHLQTSLMACFLLNPFTLIWGSGAGGGSRGMVQSAATIQRE